MYHDCKIVKGDYYCEPARRGSAGYVIGRSDLMAVLECPAHWLAGEPFKGNEHTQIGSIVDDLVCEGALSDRWAVRPLEYPEEKVRQKNNEKFREATGEMKAWNSNSTWCRAWMAEQEEAGKDVVQPWQVTRAQWATARLLEMDTGSMTVGELLEMCETQVFLKGWYRCPETELVIPVKGLPDMAVMPTEDRRVCWAYDVKAMSRTSPRVFRKQLWDKGYDVQMAHYVEMLRCVFEGWGWENVEFVWGWLIGMTESPFVPECYSPKPKTWEDGYRRLREALTLYCRCLATGDWPSYSQGGWREI